MLIVAWYVRGEGQYHVTQDSQETSILFMLFISFIKTLKK